MFRRIRRRAVLRPDAAHGRYRHPGEQGTDLRTIAKLAGRNSPLHKRHGVYIDVVTVADVPDNYDERLTTAFDAAFEKLQFRIFERHDLVLAKIVRNNDRDRADLAAIAGGPGLDIDVGPWSIKAGFTYAHAPAMVLSRVVALRLHFDDSREDNGPLRVLPGTHTLGVLSEADTDRLVREIPPVDCLVSSGGIIAMRPLILHASSKAETDHPRRVLHIEYVDSLEVDDGLRIAIA